MRYVPSIATRLHLAAIGGTTQTARQPGLTVSKAHTLRLGEDSPYPRRVPAAGGRNRRTLVFAPLPGVARSADAAKAAAAP